MTLYTDASSEMVLFNGAVFAVQNKANLPDLLFVHREGLMGEVAICGHLDYKKYSSLKFGVVLFKASC